jgi:hypothetical protein
MYHLVFHQAERELKCTVIAVASDSASNMKKMKDTVQLDRPIQACFFSSILGKTWLDENSSTSPVWHTG